MSRIGSLFSGCGGFDLGFSRAGCRTIWGCEIDPRARAVFRRHHPDAKIYNDIQEMKGDKIKPVDVLIFGSPCQDLSVAGKRAGLAGERSGLFMEAMRIVDEMAPASRPRVAVWENVPGVLSSNGGRDFGSVLWEMGRRWSGIAYRVLDLQFFGPPQRRKRVFVVGHSGGWASAGEILFESQGMRWNPPPRRKAGAEVAQALTRSLGAGGADDNRAQGGFYIACGGNKATAELGDVVFPAMQVRRLTPTECERLMGWPDGYTAWGIDDDGDRVEMSDSARYMMIGNGVGAPVAKWIAERIKGGVE